MAHDAAGNMTTVPKPGMWNAGYSLTWDAWNRLVKVDDGINTVAEYQHDGKNRRIVKKVYDGGVLDHTQHFYLSEANQVLEVRKDSSGNAHKQFTWGERYIDDLILRTRDLDNNGTIDETLYALQDANWDVTALVDASGTVVERFRYDPYGRNLALEDDFGIDPDGNSDYDWEYRFTSREYDPETGLHYFRARYWHPDLGRFIGRDSLEYVDGHSLYAGYFVPNEMDSSGTATTRCIGVGGGLIFAIGGKVSIMRCSDDCGNYAWIAVPSARVGIGFSAGGIANTLPGSLTDNLGMKGAVLDVQASGKLGPVGGGVSAGTGGVGAQGTIGVGAEISAGFTVSGVLKGLPYDLSNECC